MSTKKVFYKIYKFFIIQYAIILIFQKVFYSIAKEGNIDHL
jgi:hypothetical protein